MRPIEILSINTRISTDDDKEQLVPYDHTALSAVNTCPTWGLIRYVKHLKMPGAARALPLEAGGASHEVFAACRWVQFSTRQCEGDVGAIQSRLLGERLFGVERFNQMLECLSDTASDHTNLINFGLEALNTSGYYDDPSDRYRTLSNISESCIAWLDRYDMGIPLWVRDPDDPNTDIGVEIVFDIVVTIEYREEGKIKQKSVRYCGVLDGLHVGKRGLRVEEEKTGARLDDAWLAQWQLSHQITGYCVAASTFTGQTVLRAKIRGMKIPLGRDPFQGIRQDDVHRSSHMVQKWCEWLITTTDIVERYMDQPLLAPQYTHACNRYFRSCSFLSLCSCESYEDKEQVLTEMETEQWSPLET